jgi:hypothetical protein
MIKSCKTHCGEKINYESVEFSDGFVYELPKNNDGTVHQCPIIELVMEEEFLYVDEGIALTYLKKYGNPEHLSQKLFEMQFDIGDPLTLNDVMFEGQLELLDGTSHPANRNSTLNDQVLQGNGKFLLTSLQLFCNVFSTPFFKIGFPEYQKEKTDLFFKCPTVKIYHLEVLGKLYDILGMFPDSKKCYMLQYEITGESELVDAVKILEQKMASTLDNANLKYYNKKDIPIDDVVVAVEKTEKNIKNYINSLNLDWKKVFENYPKMEENHEKTRKDDENSLLSVNDEGFTDTMGWMDLINVISYASKNYPELKIPFNMIYSMHPIRITRNRFGHKRDFDSDSLQKEMNIAFWNCKFIDGHIEEYFKNVDLS